MARAHSKAYLANPESEDAANLRRMIGDGARHHLEEQYVSFPVGLGIRPDSHRARRFMTYVEKTLASRPAEANLGGIPSIENKIRAFLNVKYYKQGSWANPSLEVRRLPS